MDCNYMKKAKSVLQWGKLLLPLSSIRYYPPHFNLRNPVLEGVSKAFQEGHEVAIIVFNLVNQQDLFEQIGRHQHARLDRPPSYQCVVTELAIGLPGFRVVLGHHERWAMTARARRLQRINHCAYEFCAEARVLVQ